MKLKLILLILMMCLLCGCTCEYNLKIDGSTYNETFTLQEETTDNSDKSYLNTLYKEEYPIYFSEEFLYYAPNEKKEGNTYYNKNLILENNLLKSTYSATYDNDSYKDSRALKTSFSTINIGYNTNKKYYYLELENLKIFDAENKINKIIINIEVNDEFVVIKNNASNVNGNRYTWTFDDKDAELILRYQTKDNYEESLHNNLGNNNSNKEPIKNDDTNNTTSLIFALIGLITFIFVLIIFINIKNRNKK